MSSSGVTPGKSAILFQNSTRDITLIDIPTSIAIAQGRPNAILRATAPLQEPYIITHEPKTEKAKEKQAAITANPCHAQYKAKIEEALSTIRGHVLGLPFCLPRTLMDQDPDFMELEKELSERLREWAKLACKEDVDAFQNFDEMMAAVCAEMDPDVMVTEKAPDPWLMSYSAAGENTEQPQDTEAKEPWVGSFYNPKNQALDLTILENPAKSGGTAKFRFKIPPRSSVFLGDSTSSGAFRASFRQLTEEYNLPRHFDFILLDPPWPSGSAKRKGDYEQIGGMPHMKKVLSSMDIDNYIEYSGLVGIWITNKESLRYHVLGPGGLFEQWNVGLIEEWIWIKTTVKGEPMLSIDSEWRKPYETFLLGRAAPNSWTAWGHAENIKTRVIAAVPDVHSRKPCLKELIEPFMPDKDDYNALEIFSRHLVAGWTSWGNEVLKYNWDQYWDEPTDGSTPV